MKKLTEKPSIGVQNCTTMFAKLWRRVTKPVFNTKTSTDDAFSVVTAGQRTKICTISISLYSDRTLGSHQEELDFPRPFIGNILTPGIEVSFGNEKRSCRELMTIDMFVRVTKVGIYIITPEFPKNSYNFKTIDGNHVQFHVRPSEPKSLRLSGITPALGHGNGDSVYRGGTAEIYLQAKDEFGNIFVETDLNFQMSTDNSFVTMLSTTRDLQKGSYVIAMRCDTAGTASFDLVLTQYGHHFKQNIVMKIIPPPVSASNSYILQNDLSRMESISHEAGKAITFKLNLIDIFGNQISCDEIINFSESVGFHTIAFDESDSTSRSCAVPLSYSTEENNSLKQEEHSLKVRSIDLDPNACELELTPFLAGHRRFSLSIKGNEMETSVIKIIVEPGPLAELQTVNHEPPVSMLNREILSYPTELRAVTVKGIDEFGNKVVLDPTNWYLVETQDLGVFQQKDCILDKSNTTMVFHYTFRRKGAYKVVIKSTTTTQSSIKVPCHLVKVTSPPINTAKCEANICQEEPIIAGQFRPLQIHIALYDFTAKMYRLKESEIDHLEVKLNDVFCSHTFRFGNVPNEGFLTLSDIQEGGRQTVQVMYEEKRLGSQMTVDIIGLIPYKIEDYLEFHESDQNILCIGVAEKQLLGADYANVKNINRVFEIEHPDCKRLSNAVVTQQCEGVTLFDLSGFQIDAFFKVYELLSIIVEGSHHYRNQAHEFGNERERWKEKATEAYNDKNYREARECKLIKERYGELMSESHERASDAIFKFYNYGRPRCEIDLHGQLVGDSEKFKDFRKQLLSKGDKSTEEVDAIIERQRNQRNEAIRKLDERLQVQTFHEKMKWVGEDWLEIIDGAGHHSARGQQKIRPKITEYLGKKNVSYLEANEGALLITFTEYTGEQPCVGNFYCKVCNKTWISISSWKGFFQQCYKCKSKGIDSNCYPFKLRSVPPPRRHGNDFSRGADHVRLCQKCIQLGRDCRNKTY